MADSIWIKIKKAQEAGEKSLRIPKWSESDATMRELQHRSLHLVYNLKLTDYGTEWEISWK
jgi:hypothetical protein